MTPLRIGIIGVLPPEYGGAGTLTQMMLRELIEASHKDELIYISEVRNNYKRFFAFMNDFLISLNLLNFFATKYDWKMKSSLDRDLVKNHIDIVVFFSFNPKAKLINYTPFVVTIWDIGHLEYPFLSETGRGLEFKAREKYYLSVLPRAQSILVDSEMTKEKIVSAYGILESKIIVMPFAPIYPKLISAQPNGGVLYYPAHFWTHKNHIILLKALILAKERFVGTRKLVFSGIDKGNLSFILRFIKENGLDSDVELVGFLSAEELEKTFENMAALVYPSILGPTNLPPVEALLRNRPALVSERAIVGMPEFNFTKISDSFDAEAWVEYFDMGKAIEIDNDAINVRSMVDHTHQENVKKFSLLLGTLRALRDLGPK